MNKKQQKKQSAIFNLSQGVNGNFKKDIQEPIDLIKDRMRKSGQLPNQKQPIFVDNHGKPIFDEKFNERVDKMELPDNKQQPVVMVDGYTFPVSKVGPLDALIALMYVMVKHFSQDPDVKKTLAAFNFGFKDVYGTELFPYPGTSVKKEKRVKNVRKRRTTK